MHHHYQKRPVPVSTQTPSIRPQTRRMQGSGFALSGALIVLALLHVLLRNHRPASPAAIVTTTTPAAYSRASPPRQTPKPDPARQDICHASHALASLPIPWSTGVFMTLTETLGIDPNAAPFVVVSGADNTGGVAASIVSWSSLGEKQRAAVLEAWVSTVELAGTAGVDAHGGSGGGMASQDGEHRRRRLMGVLALVALTLQDDAARAHYFEVMLPAMQKAGEKAVVAWGKKRTKGEREREMRRAMRDELVEICRQAEAWPE